MFQYIVENTVFNHPQYYFTTNICSFYRMYMYSFKLHMRKLGFTVHSRAHFIQRIMHLIEKQIRVQEHEPLEIDISIIQCGG